MKIKIIVFIFFLSAITTLSAKNDSVGLITKVLPELKCNQLVDSVLNEFEQNKTVESDSIKRSLYIVSIVGSPYNCTINIAQSPSDSELVIANRNLLGFVRSEGDYFVFCDIYNTEWYDILKSDEACIHEFKVFNRLTVIYEKEWNYYIRNGSLLLVKQVYNSDEMKSSSGVY